MKLKLIIEVIYEVDDETALSAYGTTDPDECARIDATNPPMELMGCVNGTVTHRVEVA